MKKYLLKAVICIIALSGLALFACGSFAGAVAFGLSAWMYERLIPDTEEV